MGTKQFVIAIAWAVALICFAFDGFNLYDYKDFSFTAIGLFLTLVGFVLDKFWTPGA